MNRPTLLAIIFAYSFSAAQALPCRVDRGDLADPLAFDRGAKSEQLWSNWYKEVRTEFPKRVGLIYASLHPEMTKSPKNALLAFDVDAKTLDVSKITDWYRSQQPSDFTVFCQKCLGKIMTLKSLHTPSCENVNARSTYLMPFQAYNKSQSMVRAHDLSDADVDYLLGLPSERIKELLNLPSDQLRSSLDSGMTIIR